MVSGAVGVRSARRPSPGAGPDLRDHEVAQPDRRQDSERDPLDAVGQEWPRVEVGKSDHPEAARLILDQLQIGPGQRNTDQRGDLAVLIEYTCRAPSWRNGALPSGAGSESRSRAVIVTVPAGGGAIAGIRGALLGFHVPAVDQDCRTAVDGERHQHLECGIAIHHPKPRQHLAVRTIVSGGRHPLPLLIGRRRILLWQNACHRDRFGGQGSGDLSVLA